MGNRSRFAWGKAQGNEDPDHASIAMLRSPDRQVGRSLCHTHRGILLLMRKNEITPRAEMMIGPRDFATLETEQFMQGLAQVTAGEIMTKGNVSVTKGTVAITSHPGHRR